MYVHWLSPVVAKSGQAADGAVGRGRGRGLGLGLVGDCRGGCDGDGRSVAAR
ncbi:hypothetical protein VDGL01_02617 [Verticillium dahliae]